MTARLMTPEDLDLLDWAISDATGELPKNGRGLDFETAECVDALAALHRQRFPDAVFVERLEQRFAEPASSGVRRFSRTARVETLFARPARVESTPATHWRPTYQRIFAHVSLLIVLAVMVAGMWSLSGQFGRHDKPEIRGAATGQVLGAYPFSQSTVVRITLDPGATTAQFEYGPAVFLVEDGEVEITPIYQSDPRTYVFGDVFTTDRGLQVLIQNKATVPATVLIAEVTAGSFSPTLELENAGVHVEDVVFDSFPWENGQQATVVVQSTVLEPGKALPRLSIAGNAWILNGSGELALTVTGDKLTPPLESGVESVRQAQSVTWLYEGSVVDARNAGTVPLTVTVVTITMSSEESADST